MAEVHEKAEMQLCCFQIFLNLGTMFIVQIRNRLQLNNYFFIAMKSAM